jgi:membrane-bound lytic murein transglycosylase D
LGSDESIEEMKTLSRLLQKHEQAYKHHYERYKVTIDEHNAIKEQFDAAGIPPFFSLIPYAESNFKTNAVGRGVAGLWQMCIQTASNFGLKVRKGNDERLDSKRSTDATIRYIKALKEDFGTWYLADFAYAMGEGNLKRMIKRHGSKKISVLLKDPHFPRGTEDHFAKTLLLDAQIHYVKTDEEKGEE